MVGKSHDSIEKGTQPLDQVLIQLELDSHALVEASGEQLTHKMVAKGRKGRRLTMNIQMKILRALNAAQSEKVFTRTEIFNYKG